MDTKHGAPSSKHDVKQDVTHVNPQALISPPMLEYMLLRSAPGSADHTVGRRDAKDGDAAGMKAGDARKGGGEDDKMQTETEVGETDGPEVGYLAKYGDTIAFGDLQGQTAPEPDWYHPIDFVCMHCLQPAHGIPIGWPVSFEKTVDKAKGTSGPRVWTLRGRFGSVGCALRYNSDNRYTFVQETSGMLPVMLFRVYGFKGDLTEIPIAPARTQLPPFQPELAKAWAEGKIQFDGLDFHRSLNANVKLNPPNPNTDYLTSDRAMIFVDVNRREKIPFKAPHLKRMLPNLYSRPKSNHHSFSK